MDWAKTTARGDKKQLSLGVYGATYTRGFMVGVLGRKNMQMHRLDS